MSRLASGKPREVRAEFRQGRVLEEEKEWVRKGGGECAGDSGSHSRAKSEGRGGTQTD